MITYCSYSFHQKKVIFKPNAFADWYVKPFNLPQLSKSDLKEMYAFILRCVISNSAYGDIYIYVGKPNKYC